MTQVIRLNAPLGARIEGLDRPQASTPAVAALLAAMPQEHERSLGAWQAELAEWPQLLMSAHGSVRALAAALPGLQVDAERMRSNIDRLRAELPRDAADEWFDPAYGWEIPSAEGADGLERRLPRFAYFPFSGGPRQCPIHHRVALRPQLNSGNHLDAAQPYLQSVDGRQQRAALGKGVDFHERFQNVARAFGRTPCFPAVAAPDCRAR